VTDLGQVKGAIVGDVLDAKKDWTMVGFLRCRMWTVEDAEAIILDRSRLGEPHSPNSSKFS
jgi:hypothetical protein